MSEKSKRYLNEDYLAGVYPVINNFTVNNKKNEEKPSLKIVNDDMEISNELSIIKNSPLNKK